MSTAFSYTPSDVDRFFHSRVGRRLGIQGKEAEQLAFYVLTNRLLDIGGDYRLLLKVILRETGFERQRLKRLFSRLSDCNFCSYDWRKQRVRVPLVKRIYSALGASPSGAQASLTCDSYSSKQEAC